MENRTDQSSDERQFVTFTIGDETYGLPVMQVQSINEMIPITHVPNTPPFMKGMINLRGVVIPVIDMRIKFNMEERPYDSFNVIIIVEVKERLIGMIVDTVSDVVNIPVTSIQETPQFSARIKTDFIEGIGHKDNNLIIILNVDKILSGEEMTIIEKTPSDTGAPK